MVLRDLLALKPRKTIKEIGHAKNFRLSVYIINIINNKMTVAISLTLIYCLLHKLT